MWPLCHNSFAFLHIPKNSHKTPRHWWRCIPFTLTCKWHKTNQSVTLLCKYQWVFSPAIRVHIFNCNLVEILVMEAYLLYHVGVATSAQNISRKLEQKRPLTISGFRSKDYITTTLQWAVWDPLADICEGDSISSGSIICEKFIKDSRNSQLLKCVSGLSNQTVTGANSIKPLELPTNFWTYFCHTYCSMPNSTPLLAWNDVICYLPVRWRQFWCPPFAAFTATFLCKN